MLSGISENTLISSYCCRVKGKRLMHPKTVAYKRSGITGDFYFFSEGKMLFPDQLLTGIL